MAESPAPNQGIMLISVFLNAVFFGVVSQQFHTYWAMDFKDPIRLRFFVIVQFLLVAFQSLLLWDLAWDIFVVHPSPLMRGIPKIHALPGPPPGPPPLRPWEGPINSLCQLLIILMADIYLAYRIYTLTKRRVQCAGVIALSVIAFVLGMVTNVMSLRTLSCTPMQTGISVAWHAVEAVAKCFITFFLSRVLLKSRSGVPATDTTINHIVRGIIQTGCLATAWAIVALATWFLLPNTMVYRFFDVTSGAVYTHAIFDTLLSRIRLRERLESQSHFRLEFLRTRREPSRISEGPRVTVSKESNHSPTPVRAPRFEPESAPASKNDGVIELESRAVG